MKDLILSLIIGLLGGLAVFSALKTVEDTRFIKYTPESRATLISYDSCFNQCDRSFSDHEDNLSHYADQWFSELTDSQKLSYFTAFENFLVKRRACFDSCLIYHPKVGMHPTCLLNQECDED